MSVLTRSSLEDSPLADLHVLVRAADITAAMSVEALLGTDRAFAEDLMALRPHPGQTASAANPAPSRAPFTLRSVAARVV